MGLLDSLSGPLLGSLSGVSDESHEGLVEALGELIENAGGIEGLDLLFKQHGLGPQIASWIGNGPNEPISPQQLQAVVGTEPLQRVAQKLGLDTAETTSHLAQLLPLVIDKLTPGGTVPEWGALGGLLGTLE